jgi:hypothetical protein
MGMLRKRKEQEERRKEGMRFSGNVLTACRYVLSYLVSASIIATTTPKPQTVPP